MFVRGEIRERAGPYLGLQFRKGGCEMSGVMHSALHAAWIAGLVLAHLVPLWAAECINRATARRRLRAQRKEVCRG